VPEDLERLFDQDDKGDILVAHGNTLRVETSESRKRITRGDFKDEDVEEPGGRVRNGVKRKRK